MAGKASRPVAFLIRAGLLQLDWILARRVGSTLQFALLVTGRFVNQPQSFRTNGSLVTYLLACLPLAACGGAGSSGPPPTAVIFGSITGLEGSGLVLQNNGGSDLEIPTGGKTFLFSELSEGATYRVTIKTQPTVPTQVCTVSNGSGVAFEMVTTVSVACTTTPFAVRGSITGLTGTGLTVLLNGGGEQSIAAGATTFAFPPMLSGAHYAVTLGAQPSGQTCVVNNGIGVVGAADVTSIVIGCGAVGFTVGGPVSGLGADGLTLRLNGGTPLAIAAVGGNGSFAFPTTLQTGNDYSVTVASVPTAPRKSCVLGNAKGRVGASSVTDVGVRCYSNGLLDSYTGTYALLQNGRRNYFTLWFDGTYSLATRSDDVSCTNNGNGVEYGVYKRATDGTFSILVALVDNNGTCGVWSGTPGPIPQPGAGFEGTMVRTGNTLTLTSPSDGSFTLNAVESVATSLVGSFTRADGVDGSFIVFESDGTYLYQEAQQGGGTNFTPVGYERGCYTVNGAAFTTSLAAACRPNGFPALDGNGTAGFSGSNGAAIPFAITSATTVTIGGVQYNRILPAG